MKLYPQKTIKLYLANNDLFAGIDRGYTLMANGRKYMVWREEEFIKIRPCFQVEHLFSPRNSLKSNIHIRIKKTEIKSQKRVNGILQLSPFMRLMFFAQISLLVLFGILMTHDGFLPAILILGFAAISLIVIYFVFAIAIDDLAKNIVVDIGEFK